MDWKNFLMAFISLFLIACVQEIQCPANRMLCPDGSYSFRVPPSCDFAPCDIANNSNFTNNGYFYILRNLGNSFSAEKIELSSPNKSTRFQIFNALGTKPGQPFLLNSPRGISLFYISNTNSERSVFFTNGSNQWRIFTTGQDGPNYSINWPTASMLGNGGIIVAFDYVNLEQNSVKSNPSQASIKIYHLGKGGWEWLSDVKSDPAQYPIWSGMWYPQPIPLADGTLGLLAGEQQTRKNGSGSCGFRDDTVVFLKSFDNGKTWPFRSRVYVHNCTDNNEPSIVQLSNATLAVVFHSTDIVGYNLSNHTLGGSIKIAFSDDGGSTWSEPRTILESEYPFSKDNPKIMVLGPALVVSYLAETLDEHYNTVATSQADIISYDNGTTWSKENLIMT